jgi:hypothetical protein
MEKSYFKFMSTRYPLILAFATQVVVLLFLRNVLIFTSVKLTILNFVLLQGILCALICQFVFKLPRWFFVISFLFPLCVNLALTYLHVSAGIYGGIFIVLALIFSHTLKERVPLYLTNNTTHAGLKKIIQDKKAKKVLDLGSGLGGVVRALSSAEVESNGVESAPLLWFVSSFWSKLTHRGKIFRKNIWHTDFHDYDVIYAFLSPAIMEKLFQKVKDEMKPGSLFISNSFVVPGVKAHEVVILDDGRETKLYIYRQ